MKLWYYLIFITLVFIGPRSMAQKLDNELFIKIKLQHVNFLEMLNDRRYNQRRYISKLRMMDDNFNISSIDDVNRLAIEYKNLLIFKDYFKNYVGMAYLKNRVNDIFAEDYSDSIIAWKNFLESKAETIVSNTEVKTVTKVVTKERPINWKYILIALAGVISIIAGLYFRIKYLGSKIARIEKKNQRTALVNKSLKMSKEKCFYIAKGNKIVYAYDESGKMPKFKTVSQIEENFLSKAEFQDMQVNNFKGPLGSKYFNSTAISGYKVYDLVSINRFKLRQDANLREQISSAHS